MDSEELRSKKDKNMFLGKGLYVKSKKNCPELDRV